MSGLCRCLPLLSPFRPSPRLRIPPRPLAVPPSTRILLSSSPRDYTAKRWIPARVSCFMEEKGEVSSLRTSSPEFVEVNPAAESDEAATELDEAARLDSRQPHAEEKHWVSSIRKIVNRAFILHAEPWSVPWTAETIVQVMLLWVAAFWFVGSWIIPFLAHTAGFSKESLTHRGQALYSLLTDIAEGLAGIAILHRCLTKFRPLPSGWFCFSLRGSWHVDVGLGCLLFPVVNFLSRVNLNLVPGLPVPPVGVSSVEQSIVARDPVAMALYAVVVSVCAPIWEEVVFRGFLLPSLTRYMPLWSSILVSAVAFALAHFNAQRLLPLVFLGVVMGAVFARSRNLLASILLHSLWNGFVFWDLMK